MHDIQNTISKILVWSFRFRLFFDSKILYAIITPMDELTFKKALKRVGDWVSAYMSDVGEYPVLPDVGPGEIIDQLPSGPPIAAEDVNKILDDFDKIILPGVTHWQHPGFHAYFPANNSYPSILAEVLTAALGVQGMKWVTSPSATELEKVIMKWLQQMLGLPANFEGVIMDTASLSTLCALLAAREKVTAYTINLNGFQGKVLRVYCSEQAHSSIDKAVRIAGFGLNNLIKIPTDGNFQMKPTVLEEQITKDISKGLIPCCIIGALGTTGSGANDPLEAISSISKRYNVWFHIDAAYSGSALILPEFRALVSGYGLADSFVFNPHKWLFTNFDCSAFFVKDKSELIKTFTLVPEYLSTNNPDEIDYSNWGVQLGRRFRSLKLWFVIRSFGLEGLKDKLRLHIRLGEYFESLVNADPDFEIPVNRQLNIVCFRYVGCNGDLNDVNKVLLEKINRSGKIFLSHTILNSMFVIRFVCGQTNVKEMHIDRAWKCIKQAAEDLG